MLPSIIHYDQNAFVKGRNIFDAVRTINDIFDFTQIKNYDAVLTAIDFEKAFDSLNLNFLFHSLEAFGFGESLIAWISKSSIAHLTSPFEPNSFYILYENDIIPLEKVQSKSIYNKFVSKVCTKPTARKKYEESFNTEESQLDWKKIYLTPIRATLSTKLREFQYKILNRILYTNDMLFKFKKIESPLCYFCENDVETIEHFLFLCPRVQVFWNEVCSTFGEKLK